MPWSMVIMMLMPVLVFGAFWAMFPSTEPPPKWRLRLADLLERAARKLRRRPPPGPDPFVALWLQTRLGAVADHVRALELDPRTFARAERIIATQLAYDDLLAEACRLAGVDVIPRPRGDAQERFREEVELAARGWTW